MIQDQPGAVGAELGLRASDFEFQSQLSVASGSLGDNEILAHAVQAYGVFLDEVRAHKAG